MTEQEGFERRWDVEPVEAVDRKMLMPIDYLYPGRMTEVEYSYPEFTSVCPWTGLADFGELIIRYVPRNVLVELKSLKYYLHSFRNVGILQEHVVNKVLEDLVAVLDPLEMEVVGRFNLRGGMGTTATARYRAAGRGGPSGPQQAETERA